MNGKPISKAQADAIKKILNGEATGKPTRNGKAKGKPKRKATPEESEMGWILVAAAFLFFVGYFYYKTGEMPF